jgi:hypothetical protein
MAQPEVVELGKIMEEHQALRSYRR